MNHKKKYPKPLIEELKSYITKAKRRTTANKKMPEFFFLCGCAIEDDSLGKRRAIELFLKGTNPNSVCVFAEDLFLGTPDMDLMSYEQFLAEASDWIILFVESMGTACELGVFSVASSIRKKLVIINDVKHETIKSFINNGPIQLIKTEKEGVILFADFAKFLMCPHVDSTIRGLVTEKSYSTNGDSAHIRLKSFIVEILDLIAIFGPITQKDVIILYKDIKGFTKFDFTNEEGEKRRIIIEHVFDLLRTTGILITNGQVFTINPKKYNYTGLIFEITESKQSELRMKLLAKKYKYDKDAMRWLSSV